MRRIGHLLFSVMIAGCGVPAPPPGDAGPVVRFEVETLDARPCPEWELAIHPQPELPLDAPAVPTIIWEWDPATEPELVGLTPGFSAFAWAELSISATGTLWMRGPAVTDMAALGRDGRLVFFRRFDDPREHRIGLGGALQAPDDTVFFASGGEMNFVAHYSVDAELGRRDYPPAMFARYLSIGPHGRVYAGGQETCRLEYDTRAIRLDVRLPDGTVENRWRGGAYTTAEGALIGNVTDLRSRPTIEADGTPGWRFGVEPELPIELTFALATASVAAGLEYLTYGNVRTNVFRRRLVRDDAVLDDQPSPITDADQWHLDPTGARWRFSADGTLMEREGHWPARATPCAPALFQFQGFEFAEDGTLVCVSPDSHILAISPEDGSTLWDLAPRRGDESWGFAVPIGPDLDGRLYVAVVHVGTSEMPHIMAIQTNLRPPDEGYCRSTFRTIACNRHRSGWARDYRPRPADAP